MSLYPGNTPRPPWWDCRRDGHMWRMVKPIKCAFCGKLLADRRARFLSWRIEMADRIRTWWHR